MPDLPPDIKQQIRLHAESEWPDDFEMQKHVVGSQSAAYWQLQALATADGDNLIVKQALAHAAAEWSDDFEMQLHTAQNQIGSAHAFFSFKHPSVPEQVMDKIRAKAVAEWPEDREMQMHTLTNQVEAWLSLKEVGPAGVEPTEQQPEVSKVATWVCASCKQECPEQLDACSGCGSQSPRGVASRSAPDVNTPVGRVDNWGMPVPEHVLQWESEMAGRRSGRGAAIPAIVIVVLVLAVIGALGNAKGGNNASGERTSTPSDHGASGPQTLFVSGLAQVAVARTQEALDRFIKASSRNDTYEYAELARSGDIVLVDNGTKVQVLGYGFARHEIRVMEGPEAGASGWVPREWIRGR